MSNLELCPVCSSELAACAAGQYCSNRNCRWVDGLDCNNPPGKPEGKCPHGIWNSKKDDCLSCQHDKSKNYKVLASFVRFCEQNPELRFWQALRNWSGYHFIIACGLNEKGNLPSSLGTAVNSGEAQDTYYWESRSDRPTIWRDDVTIGGEE